MKKKVMKKLKTPSPPRTKCSSLTKNLPMPTSDIFLVSQEKPAIYSFSKAVKSPSFISTLKTSERFFYNPRDIQPDPYDSTHKK